VKDTLFFFSDYEGRRDSSEFSNAVRTTPLPHVYQGSVAYINNNAGCTASSRLNTTPSCITILTPAQVAALDPQGIGAAAPLLNFLNSRYPTGCDVALGNGINTCGFRFNSPVTLSSNIWTNKVDFVRGGHRLFGRFTITRNQNDRTDGPIQQFPGDDKSTVGRNRDWAFAIGHTWNMNSTMVNQATFGVTKQIFRFDRVSRPSFPNSYTFGTLSAPFVGLSSQGRNVPVPTIRDDFTWTKGNHTLQFGASIKPIRQDTELTNDFNFVTIGLGGLTTTLNAGLRPANILNSATARSTYDGTFAFILGRFASIATNFNYDPSGSAFPPGTGKTRNWHYNEYEFYAQDTWRLRTDLTFTAGLRWSYYSVPFEGNGFQAVNDVDVTNLFAIRMLNGVNGVASETSEPLLRYDLGGKGNRAAGYSDPDLNNFGPRVALAYSPSFRDGFLGRLFGDRKTSIRGGAGIVYDRVSGAITFIQDQVSYIFDNSTTTTFGNANATTALLNDPRFTAIGTLPVTNVAPIITRPFTPFVTGGIPDGNATGEFNFAVAKNFRTPYSHTWDFSIQRELPGNMLFEVSYVGRQGRKLFSQADAAQIVDFRDPGSGQGMQAAFQALQTQIINGSPITTQPWMENQLTAGIAFWFGPGVTCASFGSANCTQLVSDNFGSLVEIGDLSDTIQALYGSGILVPNVGLSGQFSTNIYNGNFSDSTYHGLLFNLRKRFSQGFQVDFNYTFSKSIDNQSSVVNTVAGGLVCDLRDMTVCRGPSDFDSRHVFNVVWVAELPFGKGRYIGRNSSTLLDYIIGGWEINGILQARSGFAMSTTTGSFPVGFNWNSAAVQNGSGPALQRNIGNIGTQINFFGDPAAALALFSNPLAGTIGNRNSLYGPRFFNIDIAVLKNFKMPWSEKHRLQFRAEAFNMLNNVNFNNPALNINSAGTFGQITSQVTPQGNTNAVREIQFALRYDF
jgi:hypothetical protein